MAIRRHRPLALKNRRRIHWPRAARALGGPFEDGDRPDAAGEALPTLWPRVWKTAAAFGVLAAVIGLEFLLFGDKQIIDRIRRAFPLG